MRLKEIRKNNNLSQQNVAESLNIPLRTYCGYEREERTPTPEMMCKMADFFDVSLDELLGRSTAPAMFDDARTSVHPLIDMYNRLTPHQQELIVERMQGFIDGNQERQSVERGRDSQTMQYFALNRETKTE